MKGIKKAFTIVELVIVIAVIAILAAILIPMFTGVIEKANQSTDIQLVKNLNTAVSLELQSQGKTDTKYATAYDAVVVCANAGYLVDTIVAKSSMDIAWSRETGYFVLVNTATGEIIYPKSNDVQELNASGHEVDYFIFRSEMPEAGGEEAKYSVFAGNGWEKGKSASNVVLNSVGFDAGYHQGIASVTYSNGESGPEEVLIRTNADNLTLNINDTSASGKIVHYGQAGYLNIIDCAPCSYHENGTIEIAKMATGRIVLEGDSNVSNIHFVTTNGIFDNIIVDYSSGVKLPDFSRDSVEIPATGRLVVELQQSEVESDYIWLYNNGTLSQVVVVDQEINAIQPNGNILEGVKDGGNIQVTLGVVAQPQDKRKAAAQIANYYNGTNVDTTYNAFDLDKKAPIVNSLGVIQGGEDLGTVVADGSKDVTEIIKKATCQHPNLPATYEHDDDTHYKICPDCGKHVHTGMHDSDGEDYACSVCEFVTGRIINTKKVSATNSLQSVVASINTEIISSIASDPKTHEKHYEYTIELSEDDCGATWSEEKKGWIANVYVIKQYPTWNGSAENSNINSEEWKKAENATITIIGSNDSTKPLVFRGIFVVVGHGNSKSYWEASPELAATTFKNIKFDYSNVVGVEYGENTFKDGTYKPILACAGSQNITVENCQFINTGRIDLSKSGNTAGTGFLVEYDQTLGKDKLNVFLGYSFNTKIINCTFKNVTCAIQGYFKGEDVITVSGCSGTVGSFLNDQTGGGKFIFSQCNIEFTETDGYCYRTNNSANATFMDCTFTRKSEHGSSTKYGLVVLRGVNKMVGDTYVDNTSKVSFTNCTFTGDKYCNRTDQTHTKIDITFTQCTGISSEDVGSSIPSGCFTFN